jgi:hypothetical protein
MVMGLDDSELRAQVKAEAEKGHEVGAASPQVKEETIAPQPQAGDEAMLEIPPEFEVPSMMEGIEIEGIGLNAPLNDDMDLS